MARRQVVRGIRALAATVSRAHGSCSGGKEPVAWVQMQSSRNRHFGCFQHARAPDPSASSRLLYNPGSGSQKCSFFVFIFVECVGWLLQERPQVALRDLGSAKPILDMFGGLLSAASGKQLGTPELHAHFMGQALPAGTNTRSAPKLASCKSGIQPHGEMPTSYR